VQPVFGALADRHGSERVLIFGRRVAGHRLLADDIGVTQWALITTLGVISAAGAGAGSFSVLIGATAQRIAPERGRSRPA